MKSFVTITIDENDWEEEKLLTLPRGGKTKILAVDKVRDVTDILIKFPPKYFESRHTHDSSHNIVVFDGKMPLLKVSEQERREHRKVVADKKMQQAMEDENFEDVYKYSKQTTRLTKDMAKEARLLLDALGLPTIQAPGEADAQAAFICKKLLEF